MKIWGHRQVLKWRNSGLFEAPHGLKGTPKILGIFPKNLGSPKIPKGNPQKIPKSPPKNRRNFRAEFIPHNQRPPNAKKKKNKIPQNSPQKNPRTPQKPSWTPRKTQILPINPKTSPKKLWEPLKAEFIPLTQRPRMQKKPQNPPQKNPRTLQNSERFPENPREFQKLPQNPSKKTQKPREHLRSEHTKKAPKSSQNPPQKTRGPPQNSETPLPKFFKTPQKPQNSKKNPIFTFGAELLVLV